MAKLIGNQPNQVPTNGDLGTMAYQDYDVVAPQFLAGRRNLIINGAMQVWQRGTSSSANGYQTADRMYLNASGGTATISRQSFAAEQTDVPFNPQYYLNLNVTTGNDNCGLHYKHEGTHEFANKTLTLSFYAKSSNARELLIQFQTVANNATEFANHTVTSSTFTPTSSWQRYTFEITIADMSAIRLYGSGDYTRIMISQGTDTSTSAWQLDITGVQLEVGSVATPFEHRSYGEELALCYRYYYQIGSSTTALNRFGIMGEATAATSAHFNFLFPTPMRANPSLIYDANGGTTYVYTANSGYTSTSIGLGNTLFGEGGEAVAARFYMGGFSGLPAGNACQAYNATVGSNLAFDAEL